jgi:hypothetical protein
MAAMNVGHDGDPIFFQGILFIAVQVK